LLYSFEVVRDTIVIQTQTIDLPNVSHAWSTINQLAGIFHERGHRIRVRDDAGGIVVLTGVAAVGRYGEDEVATNAKVASTDVITE
jgi:hypothetical protein